MRVQERMDGVGADFLVYAHQVLRAETVGPLGRRLAGRLRLSRAALDQNLQCRNRSGML
jgi:hypothetical protein